MSQINDKEFYKNNEIAYLKEMGFIVAGTVDSAKFKLSAKGIEQFERLVESLPAKDQVLARFMVAANAEKSAAELKAMLQ